MCLQGSGDLQISNKLHEIHSLLGKTLNVLTVKITGRIWSWPDVVLVVIFLHIVIYCKISNDWKVFLVIVITLYIFTIACFIQLHRCCWYSSDILLILSDIHADVCQTFNWYIGQTFYYISSLSDFFTNVTDDTILNF